MRLDGYPMAPSKFQSNVLHFSFLFLLHRRPLNVIHRMKMKGANLRMFEINDGGIVDISTKPKTRKLTQL